MSLRKPRHETYKTKTLNHTLKYVLGRKKAMSKELKKYENDDLPNRDCQ